MMSHHQNLNVAFDLRACVLEGQACLQGDEIRVSSSATCTFDRSFLQPLTRVFSFHMEEPECYLHFSRCRSPYMCPGKTGFGIGIQWTPVKWRYNCQQWFNVQPRPTSTNLMKISRSWDVGNCRKSSAKPEQRICIRRHLMLD